MRSRSPQGYDKGKRRNSIMLSDPVFIVAALTATLCVGLSKGGFGGSLAIFGTPILAMAVPPVQAAAILLPVLVGLDMLGLYLYRHRFDVRSLTLMLPGAIVGIGIGWSVAAYVDDDAIRFLIGVTAVLFGLDYFVFDRANLPPRSHNPRKAAICGSLAGFTSFVAHAGGPPWQIYMAPLKLDKLLFAGTGVVFFTTVNAIKLVPYAALGQFSTQNLVISACLIPPAFAAGITGAWLVKVVPQHTFYKVVHIAILLVGMKLVFDGVSGFLD
ncbi:MAG: sulfite exporter TauE/SafE family protein [Pseudomonadota bacterium]